MQDLLCPECKDRDIYVKESRVDRETGKPDRRVLKYIIGGACIAVGMLFLISGIGLFLDDSASGGDAAFGALGFGMAAIFLLIGGVVVYLASRTAYVTLWHYECDRCNHAWEEREEGGWNRFSCPECGTDRVLALERDRFNPKQGKEMGMGSVIGWSLWAAFGLLIFFNGIALLMAADSISLMETVWIVVGGGITLSGMTNINQYLHAPIIRKLYCTECSHYWVADEAETPAVHGA